MHICNFFQYQKFSLAQKELFPFAFNDIMGVEEETFGGVCSEDIISALKGHVKEGHTVSHQAKKLLWTERFRKG